MIVELGPPEGRDSLRSWLVPLGLGALLLVSLASTRPPAPRAEPPAVAPLSRTAILAVAGAAPGDLALPARLGERTRRGVGTITGLPPASVFEIHEAWWQYRLTDGRDVRLSRAPRGDVFFTPSSAQPTSVRVRGTPARGYTTRTSAVVLWTESGTMYQLSSRTLSVEELVRVANALVSD